MGRYARHQLDANHPEIRAGVEAFGGVWCPKGPLDGLVGFRGVNFLLEVKTSKGQLRASQERFLAAWRGQAAVVRSLDEALKVIGAI